MTQVGCPWCFCLAQTARSIVISARSAQAPSKFDDPLESQVMAHRLYRKSDSAMSEAPHIHGEPDYFCQYDLSETPSRFSDSLAASLGSTGLPSCFRRGSASALIQGA